MRVLILSCKTGGGHDAAGRAIAKELQERREKAAALKAAGEEA